MEVDGCHSNAVLLRQSSLLMNAMCNVSLEGHLQ